MELLVLHLARSNRDAQLECIHLTNGTDCLSDYEEEFLMESGNMQSFPNTDQDIVTGSYINWSFEPDADRARASLVSLLHL